RHEVRERKPSRDVFDMRIQAAIFVDHDDAGQFRGRFRSRVGTGGADEISFDAAVTLRRRYGFVGGLDPVIGLIHLLPLRVVGHERIDNHGGGEAAYGEALDAVHEGAAADHAVNKQVVKLYCVAGKFGFRWLHWLTPFWENITSGSNLNGPLIYTLSTGQGALRMMP